MSKRLCFLGLILFVFQCCTPVKVVSTRKHPSAELQSYKTFNFMDIQVKNDSLAQLNKPGIQMLKEAIARELFEKGFQQALEPDLWVNIGIVTEDKVQTRKTDIREAPVYIGQRRYSWKSEEVEVARYKTGTVSVDLVDAEKNEPVWEGVVQGTLSNNPTKLRRRIDEGVEILLEKLPVMKN